MGHPKINNTTDFHFEPLFLQDEEMRPLFVGLVKATFRIQPSQNGPLIPMQDQVPAVVAGEPYDDPETGSYKYEPECAPYKCNTDIVLVGSAKAPQENMRQFDCGFRVGNQVKVARIFGERVWVKGMLGMTASEAQPVTEVPLTYENAFGGVDLSVEMEHGNPLEVRNPVGKGFHHKKGQRVVNSPLPQIEDPSNLIANYNDCPAPVGFGFTSPNWHPRREFAGTYDETWLNERSPLMPEDFNPLFHNAASSQLVANGYLNGDEPVQILNASPWPKLVFHLPGLPPPVITLTLKNGQVCLLQTVLDTVIVNTEDMLLFLHYRVKQVLKSGVHGVRSIDVAISEQASSGQNALRPGLHPAKV